MVYNEAMKFNWNERVHENVLSYTIAGSLIVLLWFLFNSWGPISAFLGKILRAALPFAIGLILMLILKPLRDIAEKQWMRDLEWKQTTKRKAAVAISVIIFIAVITSFFMVLVPQIIDSVQALFASMEIYLDRLGELLDQFKISAESSGIINSIYQTLEDSVRVWVSNANRLLSRLVSNSVSFVGRIGDFFVAFIITIYLLVDEERFSRQIKKLVYSILPVSVADSFYEVSSLSVKMFNSFVYGKALDSLIIGIICAICTGLMKMPYAVLISFVIGITNMIPVFGPFIGAIPCIFILLIISPYKALEFSIFVLILQQIDGNIIGPRILGDSLGLPALWIMFAIIIGGATFGIVGMFLGVPIFSVIYYLVSNRVNQALREKRIHIE